MRKRGGRGTAGALERGRSSGRRARGAHRRLALALVGGLAVFGAWGAVGSVGPALTAAAAGGATATRTVVPTPLALSTLLHLARAGSVRRALVDATTGVVTGTVVLSHRAVPFTAAFPVAYAGQLTQSLVSDGAAVSAVPVAAAPPSSAGTLGGALVVGGVVVLAAVTLGSRRRRTRQAADPGAGSQSATNPAGFAKGRAEPAEIPATRFGDVAGLDEAVDVLGELVAYLEDPTPFDDAGADLPRGYLLVGPPGTGKTLLARAVAGEAGVPFFAMGGAEFVESYVGVGAARVRALFGRAREAGRAIVFIDEIDAIGRSRGAQSVPGNEERESTLNQLLVEMDGFSASGVVVLAATNRPDILDAALLRPGRFDRQVAVPTPDRRGRARILDLYLARRRVASEVDVDALSRRTAGFSGADLANLVNTAALGAVRAGRGVLAGADLEEALATISLGPARRSAIVAARERRITAWHEAGHALVGLWLDDATDPICVSIVPRGQAGGVTWFPGRDDAFLTRRQAKAQLAVAMGGRAAEELLLGDDFTQGAAQDFRAATELARHMVTEYGMGSIGPGYVPPEETHLGALAERVHDATGELLVEALGTARALLAPARGALGTVAGALLDEETLDAATLTRLAGPRPDPTSPARAPRWAA